MYRLNLGYRGGEMIDAFRVTFALRSEVMDVLLDVTEVKALSNHWLSLSFENGEQRLFDMKPLINKTPYLTLQQAHVFDQAYVYAGTVNWPGQIDISPETLYDQSVPA